MTDTDTDLEFIFSQGPSFHHEVTEFDLEFMLDEVIFGVGDYKEDEITIETTTKFVCIKSITPLMVTITDTPNKEIYLRELRDLRKRLNRAFCWTAALAFLVGGLIGWLIF